MKNVIIFHGTDCKPEDGWYIWTKHKLEERDYSVELPHYPEINKIPIEEFLPTVMKNHTFDRDTVLIGHSAGAPLILSILENVNVRIRQAMLVAGFVTPLDGPYNKILQKNYDWDKIKSHAENFVMFNSTNDEYGCNENQGLKMFSKLSGTLVIRNQGHFEINEFPLLNRLIGAGG